MFTDLPPPPPPPLPSLQFSTGYSMVLNLLYTRSLEEARAFLDRSFSRYLGGMGAQVGSRLLEWRGLGVGRCWVHVFGWKLAVMPASQGQRQRQVRGLRRTRAVHETVFKGAESRGRARREGPEPRKDPWSLPAALLADPHPCVDAAVLSPLTSRPPACSGGWQRRSGWRSRRRASWTRWRAARASPRRRRTCGRGAWCGGGPEGRRRVCVVFRLATGAPHSKTVPGLAKPWAGWHAAAAGPPPPPPPPGMASPFKAGSSHPPAPAHLLSACLAFGRQVPEAAGPAEGGEARRQAAAGAAGG